MGHPRGVSTAPSRPRRAASVFLRHLVGLAAVASCLASTSGCGPRRTSTPTVSLGHHGAGHHGAPLSTCELADAAARLDAWHQAAARSRLDDYLALMASDARFLGTDASERWSKAELRRYAEKPFSEGRGWEMRAIRRDVFSNHGARLVNAGELVWFDEDLDTKNLGPARGSGTLRCGPDGHFEIVHYVLSITVPNDEFPAVRQVLMAP